MNCPNCGSTAVQPTGYCGACGQAATSPTAPPAPPAAPQASWPPQPYGDTPDPAGAYPAARLPPPVDPYAAADPLTPGGIPPQPYGMPAQPYGTPTQPYGTPTQPYSGTVPSQPYGPPLPYGVAPGQPFYNPYAAAPETTSIAFSVTAFVLAGIAVLFVPILFGIVAIVFGLLARRRGERLGQLALRLASIATLVGLLFGVLVRFF